MTPERAIVGTRVKVLEHHSIETRRGLVGTVVGRLEGASTWPWTYGSPMGGAGCSGRGTYKRSRRRTLPGGVLCSWATVLGEQGRLLFALLRLPAGRVRSRRVGLPARMASLLPPSARGEPPEKA